MPNVIEIKETFCGRTDIRTHGRTFETGFITSTQKSRPKNCISLKESVILLRFLSRLPVCKKWSSTCTHLLTYVSINYHFKDVTFAQFTQFVGNRAS